MRLNTQTKVLAVLIVMIVIVGCHSLSVDAYTISQGRRMVQYVESLMLGEGYPATREGMDQFSAKYGTVTGSNAEEFIAIMESGENPFIVMFGADPRIGTPDAPGAPLNPNNQQAPPPDAPPPAPTPAPTPTPTPTPCPHDYQAELTVPSTCGEDGEGELTYTCVLCGDSYTEELPAGQHEYDTGTITREPLCDFPGELTYTCVLCGFSFTSPVDELGHEPGEWRVVTESSCTGYGSDELPCARCGEIIDTRYSDPAGHVEGEVVVYMEPRMFRDGWGITYCTVCGTKMDDWVLPADTEARQIFERGLVVAAVAMVFGIAVTVGIRRKKKKAAGKGG